MDINDNAPKFADPKEYSTVMSKDAEIGSFVFRFKANDVDINENGRISYRLAPENQGTRECIFILRSYDLLHLIKIL